jgi:REP element-mobilizing transposase RayT
MLASHIIFGAYGFWLPNDPRGSWSEFVGDWELFRYGGATKTSTSRSLAARPHDRCLRVAAKRSLRRPAVEFNGVQARAAARGFARYADRPRLAILACAILPDHVHLVVGAHRVSPARLAVQFKGEATSQLMEEGIHPFRRLPLKNGRPPKCFARGQWAVYLDAPRDVRRAIRYVEENPVREGKPRQRWSFITPLDEWRTAQSR